jgi:hypothetical protein
MQKLALLHGSLVLVLVGRTHCAEILSLNGFDWKLSRLCCGPVVVVPNATVPGGVWDNLHRAGRIGNPLYRDNDVVFANATTMPVGTRWVFAKQFGIPATGEVAAAASGNGQGTVLLELAGIQTLANVTVNGQWLINTYNMFRTWRVEVPVGLLNPHPGTNLLEVQLSTTTLETTATPQPPGFTNAPNLRDESDAWVSPCPVTRVTSGVPFRQYCSMLTCVHCAPVRPSTHPLIRSSTRLPRGPSKLTSPLAVTPIFILGLGLVTKLEPHGDLQVGPIGGDGGWRRPLHRVVLAQGQRVSDRPSDRRAPSVHRQRQL